MRESPQPLEHLLRALQELALAGLDAAELVAQRGSLSGILDLLQDPALLGALRRERDRWAARSAGDPAAASVHEIFELIVSLAGGNRPDPVRHEDMQRATGENAADTREPPESAGTGRKRRGPPHPRRPRDSPDEASR